MSHNVINTTPFYNQLKSKFDIKVVMIEKKCDYFSLYFTTNVDFIELKKFILDNIPNVRTVKIRNKFGVKNIICSNDSVEVFNPKVLQATMGSFFRVNIIYTNLVDFFTKNSDLAIYGALLEGKNIYQNKINDKKSVLLMGNESKGISSVLLPYITEQISIPRFGKAESLNVAVATAIICSEYKRN